MSGPNEETPLQYLEVTNNLDFEVELCFHGDRYTWAPGEKVNCTTQAAAHIFGFGLDKDGRIAAFHRLGWISTAPGCDYAGAMKKLSNISFKPVEQVFQMPTGEARTRRRGRRKSSGSDRPLTVAGEDGGSPGEESPGAPPAPTEVSV